MHDHRVFDGVRAPSTIEVRRHAHRLGKIRDPERKIDERIAVLEEGAAAGLWTPVPPTRATAGELILPRPDPDQPAQLAALQEPIKLLNVAAESVVVADDYFATSLLRRGENSLDTARCQRERTLAQNIDLRLERPQNVGLVKMVR